MHVCCLMCVGVGEREAVEPASKASSSLAPSLNYPVCVYVAWEALVVHSNSTTSDGCLPMGVLGVEVEATVSADEAERGKGL